MTCLVCFKAWHITGFLPSIVSLCMVIMSGNRMQHPVQVLMAPQSALAGDRDRLPFGVHLSKRPFRSVPEMCGFGNAVIMWCSVSHPRKRSYRLTCIAMWMQKHKKSNRKERHISQQRFKILLHKTTQALPFLVPKYQRHNKLDIFIHDPSIVVWGGVITSQICQQKPCVFVILSPLEYPEVSSVQRWCKH